MSFYIEAFQLFSNVVHSRHVQNLPDPDERKSHKTSWLSCWSIFRPRQDTKRYYRLMMKAGSRYIPKNNELRPRGEDSHFIRVGRRAVGVADGVGGWRKEGIDAGVYARKLMSNCLIALDQQDKQDRRQRAKPVDPKTLLQRAFKMTTAKGSSTACVVTLHGQTLRAANVGDSGFMIVRHGKVVYQSPIQQRKFNSPYQLGLTTDDPRVAQKLAFKVEVGDIVVVGTDGLLDNLFATDIEEIIGKHKREPRELAKFIAKHAVSKSFEMDAVTPFSLNAEKAGIEHKRGKVDDVTVIVAIIYSETTIDLHRHN